MKIKKIHPVSLGKLTGIILGGGGFLFGLFLTLSTVVDAVSGTKTNITFALAFIVLPLLYGIGGFLMGAFQAWLFNITVKLFGGLEIDVE